MIRKGRSQEQIIAILREQDFSEKMFSRDVRSLFTFGFILCVTNDVLRSRGQSLNIQNSDRLPSISFKLRVIQRFVICRARIKAI